MIQEVLLQHQKEKERLVAKSYVPREKLPQGLKFLETNLIKVIQGPRRAGKSVFAFLLLKDKNFAYVNFDDENLQQYSTDEILQGIFEVYSSPSFILLDEIQNLTSWELFVNKLQRRGENLLLTGSNAKLLSQELATALTGRHLPLEILPFNFRECLKAKGFLAPKKEWPLPQVKGRILNELGQFLKVGGFPQIVVENLEAKSYLEVLFDSILLKDVVKRYDIRFALQLYELAFYLCSHFACSFSYSKLKNSLHFNSVHTLQKYLEYLESAYLFSSLNRFSYKAKEQIKSPKKLYVIDNGMILAKSFQFSPNRGKLIENMVFTELLKKGYHPNVHLFYYQTRNQKEVDFVLKEGHQIHALMQVTYQHLDQTHESLKRETKALVEAAEELECSNLVLISWDEAGEEKIGKFRIRRIPLWQWLLEDR